MRELKYQEKERKLFSGRKTYLKTLRTNISKGKHTCIIAQQGFGKKTLLKELIRQTQKPQDKTRTIYIDLGRASLSPENFAIEYIATICETQPDINFLLEMDLGSACQDIIKTVANELQKIKPDQNLLLKSALEFPEYYAKHSKKKITMILGNFHEFLHFNNYAQITKVNELFNRIISSQSIAYVTTTSSKLLKKQLTGFEFLDLKSFDDEESSELIEKIAGHLDTRIKKELFSLSYGIPAVLKALTTTYTQETKKGPVNEEISLLRRLFIKELTVEHSRIDNYCKSLFSTSLNNARGSSLLKSLVKVLAANQDLKLSEIARLIYRSAPVTKSLIERLVEVDMIEKRHNTFTFTDPVLQVWCRLMFDNITFADAPDDEELQEIYNSVGDMIRSRHDDTGGRT